MSFETKIVMLPVNDLQPYSGNARTHSPNQIRQIAKSIERFGFTNPLLISDDQQILAGHGRLEAAKLLGYREVPAIRLSHLSLNDRRAYRLADNKLALKASWDRDLIAIELQGLIEVSFDVEITGFSKVEVDLCLKQSKVESAGKFSLEDNIPVISGNAAVSRPGDMWLLGDHRLLCGDPRNSEHYDLLLGGDQAVMVFATPPKVPSLLNQNSNLGQDMPSELLTAPDITEAELTQFLHATLGLSASACRDSSIAFVCMDWAHMGAVLAAGKSIFSELKELCVWNDSDQKRRSSLYRSQHELVFVFQIGAPLHDRGSGRGKTRHRSNVWNYRGVNTSNSAGGGTTARLSTKPVALVADAIKDCSRQGDIVLDPFGGFGTALLAAEKTGRKARLIEIDPAHCDLIVRRFEQFAGAPARLNASGETFQLVTKQRGKEASRSAIDNRPSLTEIAA